MQPVAKPLEILTVDEDRVACDGGGGALGHPRVYLNLAPAGEIECPYCGRRYVRGPGAKAGHAH